MIDRPDVSVVIPLFNEEENLPILQEELFRALEGRSYEIVFVDDGSKDGTAGSIRPSDRVRVLRSDDASQASLDAAAEGQQFRGGSGSCVIDHYVTRIGGHRYTELACLVKGRTGASVIVAAAPTPRWSLAEPLLERAVSAYRVR